MACVFCTMARDHIVASNTLAYAVRDTAPVTPLHTLILPNRHVADYFELEADERGAIDELLKETRLDILLRDPTDGGFKHRHQCRRGCRSDDLSLPRAFDPAPAG
jgi:ATP adenylyltransferase